MDSVQAQTLANQLRAIAKPRTLAEKNEAAGKDGKRVVFHNGRRYEVDGKLKVDPSNPELALAADEQLNGKKFTAQEREERRREMRRAVRDRQDVLLVTDSARTQVVAHSATRNRVESSLTPQPGPVIQQVNGKNISAAIPELNTKPASEFNMEPAEEEELEEVPQNEAIRLNEAEPTETEDEPKRAQKSSKAGKSKSDKAGETTSSEDLEPKKGE